MLAVFETMSRRSGATVSDDARHRFRLRQFSLAAELGNRPADLPPWRSLGVAEPEALPAVPGLVGDLE